MSRPKNRRTKVPSAYTANYQRNREREVRTAWNLQFSAMNAGLARVAPIGPRFKPHQDSLGFFVPGSAIIVWASPVIDYLKPHTISNSLVRVRFSVSNYWQIAVHEKEFMRSLLRSMRQSSGQIRLNGWRVVEPPPIEWLWHQEPHYELQFDQPRAVLINDWGTALADTCARLASMRGTIARKFALLDISPVCDLASLSCGPECMDASGNYSDEGKDVYCQHEPYLPAGSLGDINNLLGTKGSAARVYADIGMHYRDWAYPVVENF